MMTTLTLVLMGGGALALRQAEELYAPAFEKWRAEEGLRFATRAEAEARFRTWCETDDRIWAHNTDSEGGATYKLGHNAFSHLTPEEFALDRRLGQYSSLAAQTAARLLQGVSRRRVLLEEDALNVTLKKSIDWVEKGAVTPVKNQGQCGSCWSFSTTGALEGAYQRKTGTLVSFSEQMLVDCDDRDQGCGGGLMDNAFDWIEERGGLCAEEAYPYVSGSSIFPSKCRADCEVVNGSRPSTFTDVQQDSDLAMLAALQKGPVSIAIEADQLGFQSYAGGVFNAACGTNLDHGVLVVGYGTTDEGVDYYKVKNSWGQGWGVDGYILLARDSTTAEPGGECGILMQASFPSL